MSLPDEPERARPGRSELRSGAGHRGTFKAGMRKGVAAPGERLSQKFPTPSLPDLRRADFMRKIGLVHRAEPHRTVLSPWAVALSSLRFS